MKRRTLLQLLAATLVALPARIGVRAQSTTLAAADVERLRLVAEVVLPQEIGIAGRTRAVDQFLTWLQHYRAGRSSEALWWWQFSYLSSWGSTASAALRALVSLVSHDRFDVRRPTVIDAEDQLLAELVGRAVRDDPSGL